MRDDIETTIGLIAGSIVLTIAALIMIIIGGIVVSDYHTTKSYTGALCSGKALTNLKINGGTVASKGTIETCIVVSKTNTNCTYAVVLFFPPIKHWLLAGEKRDDVQSWVTSLGAADTFECYVENVGVDGTRGISDTFEKIAGYIAMVVIAVLLLVLLIIAVIFIVRKT